MPRISASGKVVAKLGIALSAFSWGLHPLFQIIGGCR
jgi:hypothetical protein